MSRVAVARVEWRRWCTGLLVVGSMAGPVNVGAQRPVASEVRQIVTFSFLPGASGEALAAYRELAVPLYEADDAMLSFRGFREVESPVSLDLIVVSSFLGMSGMDRSNAALRSIAEEAGTSIGAIYGRIGALSSGHTDQFVEMLPHLGSGDPSASKLTAFVWYRVPPGGGVAFEDALGALIDQQDGHASTPSATGRFLVSDGWHYLRFLGFDSLGAYQAYRDANRGLTAHGRVDALTVARREVIVANVPGLSVR